MGATYDLANLANNILPASDNDCEKHVCFDQCFSHPRSYPKIVHLQKMPLTYRYSPNSCGKLGIDIPATHPLLPLGSTDLSVPALGQVWRPELLEAAKRPRPPQALAGRR